MGSPIGLFMAGANVTHAQLALSLSARHAPASAPKFLTIFLISQTAQYSRIMLVFIFQLFFM